MGKNGTRRSKGRIIGIVALVIVVAALAGIVWFANSYSRADATALAALEDTATVDVSEIDGAVVFAPDHPEAGFVFYPGAKVQPEAYAPFMRACAERGILGILVKPPLNFALLDTDAAERAIGNFPDIDQWIIGGHSLGGVAASECLAHHPDDFDALVLVASYPTADLSGYTGAVVTIRGSNDTVLNIGKYEEARSKLPAGTIEIVIEGGNHAGIGNYGEQENDSAATIEQEDQQAQTADAVEDLARAA